MIDLHVNLCLTNFGGWRSTGSRSNVNQIKSKENRSNANDLGMTTCMTFKFTEEMRLNQGIKGPTLIGFV